MITLTCGCTVPFDEEEAEDRYCAIWYEWEETWDDAYCVRAYGSLCDEHLETYEAKRCKLGGELL